MSNWYRLWLRVLPVQVGLIVGMLGLVSGVMVGFTIVLARGGITRIPMRIESTPQPPDLSPVFTPEVQYWKPWIMRWSAEYGVDPDILGTVIQIESCGHFLVNSPAGAQGLFQVMPFHFTEGEDMLNPDVNAKRGINYLIGGLRKADGHIGLAMAGYNGGWGVIDWGWAGWATETRNYYRWGSLIYMDALQDKQPEESAALQEWLNAGGINLCRLANRVLFPTSVPTLPAQSG